uniref:Uncharacterized protein n=1 Tax=Romanomermis culicivorax TaxID=13658 RepID=A0A915HQS1_ROMCU
MQRLVAFRKINTFIFNCHLLCASCNEFSVCHFRRAGYYYGIKLLRLDEYTMKQSSCDFLKIAN